MVLQVLWADVPGPPSGHQGHGGSGVAGPAAQGVRSGGHVDLSPRNQGRLALDHR